MQDPFVYAVVVPVVLIALGILLSSSNPGARGERKVNSSLKRNLDQNEYRVIKDLTLPAGNGTTQIDHVIISRYGVFIVETKNLRGWIFGAADQMRWTQTIYRKKFSFQNPVHQNFKHAQVVQELLNIGPHQVHNVVVFVGSAVPKTPMPPNVIWGARHLIEYIHSKRIVVIEESNLDSYAQSLLDIQLPPGFRTRRAHIRHVKNHLASRRKDASKCPRCGAGLVVRSNSKTGVQFLSCSRFPRCRGTRPLT